MRSRNVLLELLIFASFLTQACATAEPASVQSYEECVSSGGQILRSHPPQCVDGSGKKFIKVATGFAPSPAGAGKGGFCKDVCGNGVCEEMVCMAEGCPCAETKADCPQDCK